MIALETTDDSQEEMKAKLKGERRDNIIASWSGPDRILSNIEKEGIVCRVLAESSIHASK